MTKKVEDGFKNSNKYQACNNKFEHNDFVQKGNFHVTMEYKGSANEESNLNYKIREKYYFFPQI